MLSLETRRSPVVAEQPTGARWSIKLGFVALIAVIAVYYLFLLSNGTLQLFTPELLDRVFDSMLAHLLHGEFNVDPKAIGFEASVRHGKTYTYFGIFPALLRLLALPFTNLAEVHLARLSCLAATVIFVALQLRTLLLVHHSLPNASRRPTFLTIMLAATLLSGPQIYVLAFAEVYDEAILWAVAMAAAFNLIVLRAVFDRGFRNSDLMWLALFAGLAFNTRASIGIGLYIATFLLLVQEVWRRHQPARLSLAPGRGVPRAVAIIVCDAGIVLPLIILGLLAIAVGVVNYGRWGSPFVFGGNANNYRLLARDPDAVRMFDTYGAFNFGRMWINALYYATGIPWLLKGVPPFAEFLRARYFRIEAPPITPILTNPLTILLAGIGLYRLWWKPDLRADSVAILRMTLIGHTITIVMLLAFFALTLRYRFDFAPFMTLAAFVGYRSFCLAAAETSEVSYRRLRAAAVGLCVLGIVFSHYVLILHKAWSMGVPMAVRLSLRPFLPSTYLPVPGPY
jgi:hypothetical protein